MGMATASKTQKIFNKALGAYNDGHGHDAEKLLRKIVRHEPNHLDAHFLLGNLKAMKGELKPALTHLQHAAAINPSSAQVQNNLGNVYRKLKQHDLAKQHYLAALEIEPEFLTSLQNLGYIFQAEGDVEQAIEYFIKAIAQNPDDHDTLFAFAEVSIAAKEHEQAIMALNHCLKLSNKKESIITEMLGKLERAQS